MRGSPALLAGLALPAVLLAGCGGGTTTVTRTGAVRTVASPTTTGTTTSTATPASIPAGNHGPHYFETPTHNIGCYLSAHDARCDVRRRDWSPPPEPASCKRIGLDFGQGIVVGQHRAEFVCAGDTSLGGHAVLAYGQSARRGSIGCASAAAGITCRNDATGHGFFLSRQAYRIF